MTWQPIETAPKDRYILVSPGFGDIPCVARWNAQQHHVKPRPYFERMRGFHDVAGDRGDPPTHWMELPTPPTKD